MKYFFFFFFFPFPSASCSFFPPPPSWVSYNCRLVISFHFISFPPDRRAVEAQIIRLDSCIGNELAGGGKEGDGTGRDGRDTDFWQKKGEEQGLPGKEFVGRDREWRRVFCDRCGEREMEVTEPRAELSKTMVIQKRASLIFDLVEFSFLRYMLSAPKDGSPKHMRTSQVGEIGKRTRLIPFFFLGCVLSLSFPLPSSSPLNIYSGHLSQS